MVEQDGWFSVRIGVLLPLGMHDLRHTPQIGVEHHTAGTLLALDETLFLLGKACLVAILLQYYQVAAHFRSGILRKEIVRQAGCRHKAGMAHQPFPYRFVRGSVHNALGGDECQHATFSEHVHTLDEKVIVQGYACHLSCRLVRLAEYRVENCNVTERNVAAHHVEIALEFGLNLLKSADAYLVVGIQG